MKGQFMKYFAVRCLEIQSKHLSSALQGDLCGELRLSVNSGESKRQACFRAEQGEVTHRSKWKAGVTDTVRPHQTHATQAEAD